MISSDVNVYAEKAEKGTLKFLSKLPRHCLIDKIIRTKMLASQLFETWWERINFVLKLMKLISYVIESCKFLKSVIWLFQMSKCIFRQYGPSGSIEKSDVLCILPINVINEKIYIIIWFWLVCLALISTFYLFYLIAVIFLPFYRANITSSRVNELFLHPDMSMIQ